MNLARMMTDKFFVEDHNGKRSGPFKTKFGSGVLMVFQEDLCITEGDRILQPLADGTGRLYRVEACSRSAGSRNVPPHFSIKISEAATTPVANAPAVTERHTQLPNVVHANRSVLAASMHSLAQAIDDSAFPTEQKEEAQAILRTLLVHPVVTGLLTDIDCTP